MEDIVSPFLMVASRLSPTMFSMLNLDMLLMSSMRETLFPMLNQPSLPMPLPQPQHQSLSKHTSQHKPENIIYLNYLNWKNKCVRKMCNVMIS